MIRSRRARGGEEGGEAGEKRGRGKIPAIYSANFGGAGQTREGGGEREDSRQRQLDAPKTFLWKNNVMPTSSYL